MAERDSWAVMNGAGRVVDAEDARIAIAALWTPGATAIAARQGIRPGPGTPFKVQATGTPGANVTVDLGQMLLTATRGFGSYVATLDTTKTLAILDVPADPSLQRYDLVIATQSDTYYADGSTAYVVRRVQGTPNAVPADPSTAAWPDHIKLSRVRIPALTTTITNALIDDLRPGWAVALGGLLPVADSTARAAITPYDGQGIYRQDRDWVEIHDGTAWRVQGMAVCSSTADRNSAITSPYNGLLAFTTDTSTPWIYRSGAWAEFPDNPGVSLLQTVSQSIPNGTFTDITWDAEDIDTHNGHSTTVNTDRYVLPKTGRYTSGGGLGFGVHATGSRGSLLTKNGTTIDGSQLLLPANSGGLTTLVPIRTRTFRATAGDIIRVQAYQNAGVSLSTTVAGSDQSSFTLEYRGT